MSTITRGDPPGLKNVRKTVYHHSMRVYSFLRAMTSMPTR